MNSHSVMLVFLGVFIIGIVVALIVTYLEAMMHKKGADQMSHFEMRRLYFAAGVLASMGLIFVLAMAMFYFDAGEKMAGKTIFDACSKIIPPIITLILGYYFGTSEARRQAFKDRVSQISDLKAKDMAERVSEKQGSALAEHDEK